MCQVGVSLATMGVMEITKKLGVEKLNRVKPAQALKISLAMEFAGCISVWEYYRVEKRWWCTQCFWCFWFWQTIRSAPLLAVCFRFPQNFQWPSVLLTVQVGLLEQYSPYFCICSICASLCVRRCLHSRVSNGATLHLFLGSICCVILVLSRNSVSLKNVVAVSCSMELAGMR